MLYQLYKFVIFFVLASYSLQAKNFRNSYSHYAGGRLERLKVCGERCTGTNYVMHLLHRNFPGLTPTDLNEYGHKHFLWWYGTPINAQQLERLRYTSQDVNLSGSQNCLFVVVVRNPYDWLRSFFQMNWGGVHSDLLTRGFYHFLRGKWKLVSSYSPPDGQHDEVDNRNPKTGKPFPNVLHLRKHKMLNYLKLGTLVGNFLLVRYEEVRDNPQGFIEYVATKYHLEKVNEFVPITTLRGSDIPYVRNYYFPISKRQLAFINKQIDWTVEKKLGYHKRHRVK